MGLFAPASSSATHFRHAGISWAKSGAASDGTPVRFTLEESWRRSFFGEPEVGDEIELGRLDFGDDSSSEPVFRVVFVNEAEDYFRAVAIAAPRSSDETVPHTYASHGPFRAGISGCCTISTLENAPDSSFAAHTLVDLARDDESPTTALPAIVTLPSGGVQRFRVVAQDAGGEQLRFRLTTAAESCGGCPAPQPPGLAIDPVTGDVTWDTTGRDGLWFAGVVVEALSGGAVVSSTQVDYVIRVGGADANRPPAWSGPTPADGTGFTVVPGETLDVVLAAEDPDESDTVAILKSSGPGDFTGSPGNPGMGLYSFTASSDQVGQTFIVQFIAQDDVKPPSGPPPRTFSITVANPPPPDEPKSDQDPPPQQQPREQPPPQPARDDFPPEIPQADDIDELPEPKPFETFNVENDAGSVGVNLDPVIGTPAGRRAGLAQTRRRGWIRLTRAVQVPVGALVDTKRGKIELESTRNSAGGVSQSAEFFFGAFAVLQNRRSRPVTELRMRGGPFSRCRRSARGSASSRADAARHRRRGRRVRQLWGRGKGRFRTRGRYAAATVRGTVWYVADGCNGTIVRVRPHDDEPGRVRVRDTRLNRTVILDTGEAYFARKRPRRRR